MRFLIGFLILALLPASTRADRFNWRIFNKAEDGLPASEINSVTVSPRGSVWIRHSGVDLASRLDGYELYSIPAAPGLNSRIYESLNGRIWAIYPHGLQEFKGEEWIRHSITEIRQENQTNVIRQVRPIPILPIGREQIWFLLNDRLLEYQVNPRTVRVVLRVSETRSERFLDLVGGRGGNAWISTSRGLIHLTPASSLEGKAAFREHLLPATMQLTDLQRPNEDESGGVMAVGEPVGGGPREAVFFNQGKWAQLAFPGEKIRQVWKAEDDVVWAQSITSLLRMKDRSGVLLEKESSFAYLDAAPESRGVFWVATHEGLYRHSPLTWRTPMGLDQVQTLILAAEEDPLGRVWFATPTSMVLQENDQWTQFPFPEDQELLISAPEVLVPLPRNQLLAAGSAQLIRFDLQTRLFSTFPHPPGRRFSLLGKHPKGAAVLNLPDESSTSADPRIEVFDGERLETLLHLPASIPSKNLNLVYFASNGDSWVGDAVSLHLYREKKWQSFHSTERSFPRGALCLLELGDGKIWFGGRDGVVEFDGKNWITVGPSLDRVNTLVKGADGSIWVGSNGGLYRFWKGAWVFNGTPDGLPSASIHTLLFDRPGNLWAGTTRGISRYHPEADPDPPRTFISALDNPRSEFNESTVNIICAGRDRWKFTSADRLLFSYRIDDRDWSTFSPGNVITLSGISSGKHRLEVRTMDRNWNIDPSPAIFQFKLLLPWYRETRLLIILGAGILVALFFAGLAFNRHRQLQQNYHQIEQIVALRTQQLEQANLELLHNQKMKALGTLAAGIAHDFNNILSIIKGNAQLIDKHLEEPEKIRGRLERIRTVVEQGAGIVKALLGFSRTGEQKIEKFDLSEAMAQTVQLLSERFQYEIRIETPDELPVDGVKSLVQQMLLNLIFNAADAVEHGGTITLKAGRVETLPRNLALKPEADGDYAYLSVVDTGSGIASETLPRIFEPFFTTKAFSSRRGTGLGLSMVYEIAKEMGCGLAVESTPGKGSSFTIFLPVHSMTAEPASL